MPVPACSGRTDLFYSDTPEHIERARAVCGTCPLVIRCLALALSRPERHGVWGGMSAAERTQIVARLRSRFNELEATPV